MKNILDKSINLGLGILLYSRDKVEAFVEELVDRGEVSKRDAREIANDLVQKGEEQREELKMLIYNEVKSALDSVDLAKKTDIATKDEIREIVAEQVRLVLKEEGISNDSL